MFQLAERLGLTHTSKGTGDERYIAVSKPGIGAGKTDTPYDKATQQSDELAPRDNTLTDTNEKQEEGESKGKKKKKKKKINDIRQQVFDIEKVHNNQSDEKENDASSQPSNRCEEEVTKPTPVAAVSSEGKMICRTCGKDVIKANLQLHEIHCARKLKEAQNKSDDTSCKPKIKEVLKSSQHRKYDKELAERVEKVDKDDIDALIATVQSVDNFCCFKKCKTSVQTLFQLCELCDGRYCMVHHIPEVHGCGDAARAQARARISKEGVLYRGSGVPDKRPDSAKKAHLQRKLDSKLTEMASKRKGKPKK